MRCTDSSHWL